ncbi:hypothetical protein [Spiroplasma monobiae]|uniref:Uncharacterized protein n=1 Tax=Spiroplasma monobiae MQ-1 TaxID=1336748 RepID=A0A2K9LWL0_SPISQ|nr:hypothetical protein [Spiroplasma monobiae]AUM62785.1 hypothetical protein SMONO_v1c05360 [Spiroplasma monobiae MQ-1]
MKEYICSNCSKPAELKKINQLNTIIVFCKDCAIKEFNAQHTENNNIECDSCRKPSQYMTVSQLNRIKNLCENCLLKDYKEI